MGNSLSQHKVCLAGAGSALLLAFAATSAVADEAAEDCARIASATERLACYDAAFSAEADAKQRPADELAADSAAASTAAAVTAQQNKPDQDDFGFTKRKTETEGESLTSKISGLSKDAYKRRVFELENGQIWRQIEYKSLSVDVGDVAVIRHGSFSSYKLYIGDTKRWTRVRRVK
ncbi:MAG: type VI secretion system-associated protein TagO [Gammaproteobacteria bacterium]